jgi:alkylhydroperoxidase family enzyme
MAPPADAHESTVPASLTPLLRDSMVDWDVLRQRYGGLLRLVDRLIGVVPNCDRYLEIWPPAFKTYNILVPNLLNLPVPLFGVGGPPAGVVGLAMYVSSRTAGCAYCSAHTCSFALRRGAGPDKVAAALLPQQSSFTRGELAAVAVARSLASVPCELSVAERDELVDNYGERNAEWIALGAVMMGFLNKFMDVTGVELEQSTVSEVADTMGAGWSPGKAGAELDPGASPTPAPTADGLRTKLSVLPLLPAAISFDRRAQQGTPKRWPEAGRYLAECTGHDFPVLGKLHSSRVRRAVVSMLRENLDPETSVIGLGPKATAGAVFATIVGSQALLDDVRALARRTGVDEDRLQAAVSFARDAHALAPIDDPSESAMLTLARAAAYSPARVDSTIVAACAAAGLKAPAIVELITWLSVLQMLHRLTCYVSQGASRTS